jgi:hypothetical protein
MTAAGFNAQYAPIVSAEIVCLSIVAGLVAGSLWAFLGVLVGFAALIRSRFAIVLVWLFAGIWGALAYFMGRWLGEWTVAVPVGVLGFLIGLGIHHAGIQYARDLTSPDQMEL